MRVNCPTCGEPAVPNSTEEIAHVACSLCGCAFNVVGEQTVSYVAKSERCIGQFEILDKLGTGTFGEVWRARDSKLDRFVAIKIPRKGQLNKHEGEQFVKEARAAAQLRHPNIVGVFDVGEQNGLPFIVSEYVEGLTLSDWSLGRHLPVKQVAEICKKLADAVHFAHESGIIHRDLKPSNIILGTDHEPHVMDFGLAKKEAATDVTLTMDGRILGTPAYMSPEQARGEGASVDRRADVYSLGVILYELLTGHRPFRGNLRMLLHQVIHDDPQSPRRLNGSIDRDLETICLKCLEKNPQRRYSTAQEFSDELERFRKGEPIKSRPLGMPSRFIRRCKRHPVQSGLEGGLAMAVAAIVIATWIALLWERTMTSKQAMQLYWSRSNLAYVAFNSGDGDGFEQLTEEIGSAATPGYDKGIEWDFLTNKVKEMHEAGTLQLPSSVTKVTAGIGVYAVACANGKNYYLNPKKMEAKLFVLGQVEDSSTDQAIQFSTGGNILFSSKTENGRASIPQEQASATLWKAGDETPLQLTWNLGPVDSLLISQDEATVAVLRANQELEIREFATGNLRGKINDVGRFAISPNGQAVVVSNGETLSLYGSENGFSFCLDSIDTSVGLDISTAGLYFSQDGQYLIATAHHGFSLIKVQLHRLESVWQLETESYGAAFSPDGYVAVACSDQTVKIWQLDQPREQIANLIHPSMVTSIAFARDGTELVAGCRGGSILVWESAHWDRPQIVGSDSHFQPPLDLRDNLAVHTIKNNGRDAVQLFDWKNGRVITTLEPSSNKILACSIAGDAKHVAAGDASGRVQVWQRDDASGEFNLLLSEQCHNIQAVYSLAFSANNALAAGGDGGLQIWDSLAAKPRTVPRTPVFVASLCYSINGLLAIGGGESPSLGGEVIVLDSTKDVSFENPSGECVRDLCFSKTGNMLAFVDSFSSGLVRIFERKGGTEWQEKDFSPIHCHSGKSTQLVFAGSRLITGSDNQAIRFWDVEYGQLLGTLQHHGKVREIKLLPSGRGFLTVNRRGVVRLWE